MSFLGDIVEGVKDAAENVVEGISDVADTVAEAVTSPFEALSPNGANNDPEDNNVFELTANILESTGSIPFRMFMSVGEVLDDVTGEGLVHDIVMTSYCAHCLPCGYAIVLPWWVAGAAVRGIGDKISD
jgi:hypothetical protein